MMDFKKFTKQITQDLQSVIKTDLPGTTLEFRPVEKLQGESYTALTVTPQGKNIGANINLDALYARFQSDDDYDSALQSAKDLVSEVVNDTPQFKVPDLSDYEAVKPLLFVDVVGIHANEEMLKKVPHTKIEDLAMVYRMQVGTSDNGSASVLITNGILDSLEVSLNELREDALTNSAKIRPVSMQSMSKVMAEMTGVPEEELPSNLDGPQLYVVTTEDRTKGAAALFYQGFMEDAANQLGGDFYVLPSSVHEVLLLSDDGNMTADELRHMVTSINADVVSPEDKLTDSVYHYDAETKTFEICENLDNIV